MFTPRRGASATSGDLTRGETAILTFTNSNLPPDHTRQQAARFIINRELLHDIRELTPEEQTKFMDKVDQVYPTVSPQATRYVLAFGNLCSAIERLPTSAILSAGLEKHGNIAISSGGFTDTWRGEYFSKQVTIKALRVYPARNLKEAKEIIWKRVPMWRRLVHENILPFCGVNVTLFHLALVYDWGENGNIVEYATSNPRASRPSLLLDVARGLKYLHSLDIPHGDLKETSVVIDQGGRARLTEYGLAPINSDPTFTAVATLGAVGTSRWLAPELVRHSHKGNHMPAMESKAADVFAFGMLAVKVFTGKIPLEEQKNEAAALRISQEGRPEIPKNAQAAGLTEEMWKLFEGCWQQDPKTRPTMEEVVKRLQACVANNDVDNIVSEEPQPVPRPRSGASRSQAKAGAVQPPTKGEVVRIRTRSGTVRFRMTSEPAPSRRGSGARISLESVQQETQIIYPQLNAGSTPQFSTRYVTQNATSA